MLDFGITKNVALAANGGSLVESSSEMWSATNIIDGNEDDDSADAWASLADDANQYVKIGLWQRLLC